MGRPRSIDADAAAIARSARANRVFGTDEKRIRTKNRVMEKTRRA
jgi:hypothetical protein